nr:DUF3472 domain-containing protein [Acinetobacter sp. Marseille-Q1620]
MKSAKTDANGLVEATWVAGQQPSDTINVSASLNDRSGKLTLNTTTTEVKRPWGMSNTYMHFKRPGTIKLDNVKGYKVTVVLGTEALGTYYEVMGFPGSYAGLQVSATGEKRVLHSTWDIDELGEAGKAKTTDKGDTTCKTFGNEGTGASCSMPLSWQTGRAYEFAMTYKNGTNEDGSEYTDSTMTLTDVDANKTYNLGTHRYAKKISVDQIYLFVEDFKRDTANCWDMPKRKLSVTDAQIQQTDGTWTSINNAEISLYNGKKDFECHNVNGGVEKDGNDKNRWFMASADEVVSNPYRNLKSVKLN